MKSLLASLLVAALAAPAAAGPDFVAPTPQPRPLAASTGTSEIGPLDDVVFDHDSYALLPSSMTQIYRAARWLRANPRHRIVLEGYADSTGSNAYNEALSLRRAHAVRDQLIAAGVGRDRIVVAVYGEHGATRGDHPLDRRVVMYASTAPADWLARASLQRKQARTAMWHRGGTLVIRAEPAPQVSRR